MNSKIKQDLPKLIENGVISEEVAKKIENYYSSQSNSSSNKLFTIFGVLGSLLVGLGIILILAHNWDEFSKTTKTILAFLPLLVAQIIVGYSILKKKTSTWLEASGVFLFFAVGSSISLISQIYNIPGSLSSFLLSWILLCLPLVYLLNSKGVYLLSILFATVYACDLGYSFSNGHKTPWFYILILILLLPKYYYQLKNKIENNFATILNWLFPLSIIIVFGAFLNASFKFELLLYTLLLGVIYNIGYVKSFQNIKSAKNGFLILGSLGLVITMLIISFEDFWFANSKLSTVLIKEISIGIILLFVTIFLLIKNKSFTKNKFKNLFQFIPFLLIIFYLAHLLDNKITIVLVNITVFILGITIIKKGVNKANFIYLNYGLLIITGLIACRFFDTDMTFIVRGLLFILVGSGFFATNYLMLKKQEKNLKK
ncbi:MAG: DUF2157 domain-containing protein [Polaribacter sp.]